MTLPSLAEKIILAILIGLSAAGFWYRFRRVVRIVSATGPDLGFKPGDLAPRLRDFVWEVLLQGKVIQQRPAAGVAHAFVFWGFCAFALVTVNHIAAGFGVPFLSRGSGFGRFYFGFVAVFAVAVAIAITYLAVRRFILRPVWLGKVSPESGVIAGLIFLLMITYLAGLALPEDRRGRARCLVDSHPDTARIPAAGAPYQTSAPGPEPRDDFSEAAAVQRYPPTRRRRGFRSGLGQGCDSY